MINVSKAYRNQIKQNGRRFSARGKISFSDGRTADLTGDSFMQGGVQFSDCTSASNEFDVGTAAVGKATITLKNYDGCWNGYDFTGAVITLATGLLLPDGTTEWLEKGIFTVYDPVTLGGVVVEVTAKDNMQKFDRKYDSALTYPATLAEILRDACTRCGVVLSTQEFLNDDYSVAARPSNDATTYRDIVSYVAQLAGSWARINNLGELVLGWYDTDRFYPESGNTVDGNDELTANGNPAVFDAYPNTAIRKLNSTGNTTLDGSGNASPGNIRTIHGVEYIEKWEGMSAENRNLLNPISGNATSNGVTCTVDADGTITLDGTVPEGKTPVFNLLNAPLSAGYEHNATAKFRLESGKPYTFSATEISGSFSGNGGGYEMWDTSQNTSYPVYIITSLPLKGSHTFTAGANGKSLEVGGLFLQGYSPCTFSQYRFRIQLEQGNTATSWKPALESLPSYQKIMFPKPLYSLPDGTADNYEAIGATGTEKIKKVILDGSKIGNNYWVYRNSENDTSICYGAPSGVLNGRLAGIGNSYCDKFQYAGESSNWQHGDMRESYWPHTSQSDYLLIRINKSRLSGWSDSWTNAEKVEAFKTWLSSNPVTILYELATPVAITGTPQSVTASADTTVTADNGGQVEVTYSGPDVLDGGNFSDYSQPDTVVGGVFRKNLLPPADISSLKSCTVSTDDVHITGVQIKPEDDKKPTYFKGSSGYVVSIKKNPLAQDNLNQLVANLAGKLVDFRFRPMQVSALDDPSVEAGDVTWVTAPKGRRYATIISSLAWNINSYETFAADAETPAQRQQTHFSAAAKAVQDAKDNTVKQISAYDAAVGIFSSMAALAMGLYFTRQKLDDGSFILYWHDKPKLADSQTIWKLTQNVLVVSDDGGSTWRGMDKDGNILAKVLTVIGVNASWIVAGLLKSHNGSSWINMEDGSFSFGNGALVYNPTDGFKCIESNKICMPGHPDYYAIIGKGPGAQDALGFFLVDKYNIGDYPFFKVWNNGSDVYISAQNATIHFVDTNDNTNSMGTISKYGWSGRIYGGQGIDAEIVDANGDTWNFHQGNLIGRNGQTVDNG